MGELTEWRDIHQKLVHLLLERYGVPLCSIDQLCKEYTQRLEKKQILESQVELLLTYGLPPAKASLCIVQRLIAVKALLNSSLWHLETHRLQFDEDMDSTIRKIDNIWDILTYRKSIIEIVGDCYMGKSQLLYAILSQLLATSQNVTENDFIWISVYHPVNIMHLTRIIESIVPAERRASLKSVKFISRCMTIDALVEVLEYIKNVPSGARCIMIDDLSLLRYQERQELTDLMASFRYLTQRSDTTIVFVSGILSRPLTCGLLDFHEVPDVGLILPPSNLLGRPWLENFLRHVYIDISCWLSVKETEEYGLFEEQSFCASLLRTVTIIKHPMPLTHTAFLMTIYANGVNIF